MTRYKVIGRGVQRLCLPDTKFRPQDVIPKMDHTPKEARGPSRSASSFRRYRGRGYWATLRGSRKYSFTDTPVTNEKIRKALAKKERKRQILLKRGHL